MSRTCETGWLLFSCRNWSVNTTLGQERHVYAYTDTKIFYAKMFPRKFCSLGQCFIQKHHGVLELFKKTELFKKNFQEGGGGPSLPPPPPSKKKKKNWRRVSKIFDAHCTPRVFKHFEFLFMHLWMLCAPHLVPDIEYFARINHVIFNWQQKFGNKFTRDCLK